MKLWASICSVFSGLLHRSDFEEQMDEELLAHLRGRAADLEGSGLIRAEAERQARIEFGGRERYKEECREAWGVHFASTLLQDVRFGFRMLRKAPGFAVAAILTLGLGIGANTAIFSYVDAWVIQPLPYPQPDQLMLFAAHDSKRGWTSDGIVAGDYYDFEKANTSFEETATWAGWNFNLTGDGLPSLVEGGRVRWNFFRILGSTPLHGRTFIASDDQPGAEHVAIISEGLWKERYASDPQILGRNIRIEDEQYNVVGVMPGTFQYPLMGIANIWTPLALTDKERADRGNSWLSAIGRLKPGVTQKEANAECAAVFSRLEKQYPQTNANGTWLVNSMKERIGTEEGAPQVMICLWLVALILLIACANVANLMLARAARRSKEFVVRRAVGAARSRLVRQLVSESLVLFFLGGIAGIFFGVWGMHWIESMIPAHIRGYLVNYGQVSLNVPTLAFTMGISVLCGLVFGLAPALAGSRFDLHTALKETSAKTSTSHRGGKLRLILVGAEIALAVVVLISTTLLVRSFVVSVMRSPGFNPKNVVVAQLSLPKTRYAEEAQKRNFADKILGFLHAMPQVTSTGAASAVPFGGFGQTAAIEAVDRPSPRPGEAVGARFTAVSPGYFSAMQMAVIEGRTIAANDAPGEVPSIVINQTLAKFLWPNEDPIGKKMRFSGARTVGTIVGVVNDIKMFQLRSRPERQMYVSLAQFPSATLGIVVRTAGPSSEIAAAVRDAIWDVDNNQPISAVEQLDTLIVIQDTANRVLTKIMVFFGALATLLGAIGIYGLISHLVSQRTHEIGIRVALGASPRQLWGMVIGHGLKLAVGGVAIGVAVAFGVTRFLGFMLYGIAPNDPVTFTSVAAFFAVVAVAACWIPARRAMRVDPMVALRYE